MILGEKVVTSCDELSRGAMIDYQAICLYDRSCGLNQNLALVFKDAVNLSQLFQTCVLPSFGVLLVTRARILALERSQHLLMGDGYAINGLVNRSQILEWLS
jgi:hypothetical protein